MEQSQIKALLRQKAARRRPALEKALAKKEKWLRNKDAFVKNAKARAEAKVDRMERLAAMYREDLEAIDRGSYRGENDLPFGATPTISEGLI